MHTHLHSSVHSRPSYFGVKRYTTTSSRFTSSPWMQGVVLLGAPRQLAPGELIETRLTLDLRRGGELQARLL